MDKPNPDNPYQALPSRAFWRPSVAERSMFDIEGLWEPKFNITPADEVSTFGSCFAQHIGTAMAQRGYNWLQTESPPFGMSADSQRAFGYGVFSCRTGNIYTTSLLRQWASWALDGEDPPSEIWQSGNAYFDPFRPTIEPGGFGSADEVMQSRQEAISAFRQCVERSKYMVFTLGLTECWKNAPGRYEYPMCPGTVAGTFDGERHKFVNQDYGAVGRNLNEAMNMMRGVNKDLKFLLTVSPVPLTATNSTNHVLVATTYSKSVLRAIAGRLADKTPYVDYFPSYEIITSPVFRGGFFEPNQRQVTSHGVNFVMSSFFQCLYSAFGKPAGLRQRELPSNTTDEICDEELLDAFGAAQ